MSIYNVKKDVLWQPLSNAVSGAEWERIYAALEITPAWEIKNIKKTAMARHPSKKGRQPHIEKILDEAFKLLAEHAPNITGEADDRSEA